MGTKKKFNSRIWLVLLGGIAMLHLFGCTSNNKAADNDRITSVHLTYDKYSGDQYFLEAVVDINKDNTAKTIITKRIGPMNYTGTKKEGKISMNEGQVEELLNILSRYDLEAWNNLPSYGSSTSPTRSLYVSKGKDVSYYVAWNAKFPKTLPPEEDIMYMELFNYFNDMIANEPGWEEVVGENLEDPRDNPAYGERTVIWFGNEVRLVPGTGTWYEDGRYSDIDYGDKKWWIEEGFTGEWTLNKDHPTDDLNPVDDASLKVEEDGSLIFEFKGETYKGALSEGRRYMDDAGLWFDADEWTKRYCEVHLVKPESYKEIHVTCYPNPVPSEQFAPIDVYLVRK